MGLPINLQIYISDGAEPKPIPPPLIRKPNKKAVKKDLLFPMLELRKVGPYTNKV